MSQPNKFFTGLLWGLAFSLAFWAVAVLAVWRFAR